MASPAVSPSPARPDAKLRCDHGRKRGTTRDRFGFPGQVLIVRRKLHRLSIVRNDPAFAAADFFDKGARVLRIHNEAAIGRIDTHATGQLRPLRSIGNIDGIHAGFHLRPGFINEQDLL